MKNLLPIVTSGLFATMLVAITFMSISVSASTSQAPGCFQFSTNGNGYGTVWCNSKANDLSVHFKWGPNCFIMFGTAGQPCPKGANNIEIFWGMTSTGATLITSCEWTKGNVVLTNFPCNVPSPGSSTFTIENIKGSTTTITKAYFTFNGAKIGLVYKPAAGIVTNDVEFHFG